MACMAYHSQAALLLYKLWRPFGPPQLDLLMWKSIYIETTHIVMTSSHTVTIEIRPSPCPSQAPRRLACKISPYVAPLSSSSRAHVMTQVAYLVDMVCSYIAVDGFSDDIVCTLYDINAPVCMLCF